MATRSQHEDDDEDAGAISKWPPAQQRALTALAAISNVAVRKSAAD